MSKILDKEFRNTLYKTLVDGGYDKDGAKKIVSVKYQEELKQKVLAKLQEQVVMVESDNYSWTIVQDEMIEELGELNKLNEFLKNS